VAAESRRPFDCQRCTWGRHCDESKPAPFKQWEFTHRGAVVFQSNICPLPMVTSESNALVRAYGHYRKGYLPYAGGMQDQPLLYVRAMEFLGQVFGDIEAEALARARREK
jgi:hypothetical protein